MEGLSFKGTLDNSALNKAIADTAKKIKGFADTAGEAGDYIGSAFKDAAEEIKFQKSIIDSIEKDLKKLNTNIDKMAPGQAQQALRLEAAKVTAELEGEKRALIELEASTKGAEQAHVGLLTQLRAAKEGLIELEAEGQRGTIAYDEQTEKVGKLQRALTHAGKQAKAAGDDMKTFRGVISAISGVAGAFSAAQGAIGLFAGENENLAKVMTKVQSLMAITIGLEQVSKTLNKDSYFSLVLLKQGKELLAGAELKLAGALGVSTVAAKAFMAAITGGLTVALGAIIYLVSKFVSKQQEAKKKQEEFNKAVVESAYKPLAAYKLLGAEWNSLGNDLQAKEKFIRSNQKAFEDLGVSVNNVAEAEKFLVDGTEDFTKAMIARAKVAAVKELYDKKVKDIAGLELEMEKTSKTQSFFSIDAKTFRKKENISDNPAYKALERQKAEATAAANELIASQLKFSKEEEAILAAFGGGAAKTVSGIINIITAEISRLNTAIGAAGSQDEINELTEKLKEQEALLEKVDARRKKQAKEAKEKDTTAEVLREYEQSLKRQLELSTTVYDKFALIAEEKKKLEGDNSKLGKAKEGLLTEMDEDVVRDAEKQTAKLLSTYATYLGKKLALETEYLNDMKLLQDELDRETDPSKRTEIQGTMSNRTSTYGDAVAGLADPKYAKLLKQYRDFEQKKEDIQKDYAAKRLVEGVANNEKLLANLKTAEAKDLSSLAAEQLMASADWTALFSDLDKASVSALIELKNKIESQFATLDLDPKDLDVIRKKIDEATDAIQARNPFLALSDAFKRFKADKSKDAFKDMGKSLKASIGYVAGKASEITGALGNMGVDLGEGTDEMIGQIGGMLTGATDLAMGIASGNPMQIIEGSIALITNGINLIAGVKTREIDASIERHEKSLQSLGKAYNELERAADKALGEDRFKSQKALIDNLKKQQEELAATIKDNESYKKTDDSKVEALRDEIADNVNKMKDIVDGMKDDIIGSTSANIASDLGNAFMDAFAAGEDAAAAWGAKVDDIVGGIIKRMLIQKFLEQRIGKIVEDYTSSWVNDSGGVAPIEKIIKDSVAMGEDLNKVGEDWANIMENMPDELKKYFGGGDGDMKGMTGAIKGMSEETASLLSGYINAVRLNQLDGIEIMRTQLLTLSQISVNTSYNVKILSVLETMANSNSLRAGGL